MLRVIESLFEFSLDFVHQAFLAVLLFLTTCIALILVNIPWIALIAAFSWKYSLFAVGAIGLFTAMVLVFFPEWGMTRLLRAQVPRTPGLSNSYELAHRMSKMTATRRPKLVTYADPVPNVFVIRSPSGKGVILLSDGLISILDESEICFLLSRAIRHLHSTEIYVQSGCIFILMFLQSRVSMKTTSIKPSDALRDLMVYPWLRAFRKISQMSVTRRVASSYSQRETRDFIRGAAKISRAEKLYGQQALIPGLVYLGLQR